MEHNRKQKLLMIVALVLSIASLSIGFAAFSTTLNISSSANVTPNSDTFSVKFSTNQNSLVVGAVTPSSKTSGITTTDGVIDNSTNPTITNLSATFTNPGQYIEYTFYARNEGEYTAYLNNINFIGNKTCLGNGDATESLVQSACESINITATIGGTTYTETTPITGHTLNKKTGEQIKVRLEYASSGTAVDGAFSITFPNVALIYSTIDDSSMQPIVSGKVVKLESGTLNDPGSIVSIGNEQFYVIGQEDGNVKLLSMMNITLDDNPIQSSDAGLTVFSNIGNEYSGSIVEGYVNDYALYLEGLGTNIEEARLIMKEELEGLGCSEDDESCSNASEWVRATSYWSGSSIGSFYVWAVHGGWFDKNTYDSDSILGVRPVIEISVSEF